MQALLRLLCSLICLLLCALGGLQAESLKSTACEGHVPIRPLSVEEARQFWKELRSLHTSQSHAVLLDFTQKTQEGHLVSSSGWLYSFQDTRGQNAWRLYLPATQEDFLVKASIQASSNKGSLPLEGLFQPLGPQNDYSLYDLSLLFLQWPSAYYEGSGRILGRKAHVYIVYPPSTVSRHTGPIRVYLDAHFFSLLKAEWLDASGQSCIRSLQVLSFQKLRDGSYFLKTLELKDLLTHAQTRCTFQAFHWDFPPSSTLEDLSHPPPFVF